MKYQLNKQKGTFEEITNIFLEVENLQELSEIVKFNFSNFEIIEINDLLKIVTIKEK